VVHSTYLTRVTFPCPSSSTSLVTPPCPMWASNSYVADMYTVHIYIHSYTPMYLISFLGFNPYFHLLSEHQDNTSQEAIFVLTLARQCQVCLLSQAHTSGHNNRWDCLQLSLLSDPNIGFIDASKILQASHIIPWFSLGHKYNAQDSNPIFSKLANDSEDWNEYHVNR